MPILHINDKIPCKADVAILESNLSASPPSNKRIGIFKSLADLGMIQLPPQPRLIARAGQGRAVYSVSKMVQQGYGPGVVYLIRSGSWCRAETPGRQEVSPGPLCHTQGRTTCDKRYGGWITVRSCALVHGGAYVARSVSPDCPACCETRGKEVTYLPEIQP